MAALAGDGAHNLKVVGSNATPATTFTKQLHCVISHSKGAACVADSGVEAQHSVKAVWQSDNRAKNVSEEK
jgi:hypothetical protein